MNPQSTTLRSLTEQPLLDTRDEPQTAQPKRNTLRQIIQLSPNSPAVQAGLNVGDYLISVNNTPAPKHHFWRDVLPREEMVYRFWLQEQECVREIRTGQMPLGTMAVKTAETILAEYAAGRGHHEDLIDLWLQSDWKTLKTIGDTWKKPGRLNLEWQIRVKGRDDYSWVFEYLFKGIAEYEVGDRELGAQIIEDFAEHELQNSLIGYHAIIWHNRAKRHWQNFRRDEAIEDLHEAHFCERLPPLLDTFADFGLQVPTTNSPILGEEFPINYELPVFTNISALASLQEALESLPENALHLICMLPHYRSNQPYNRLMRRMQTFHRCLPEIFHSMHILIGKSESRGWEYHEASARQAGVPFKVLLDRLGVVYNATYVRRVPELYGVNREGKIVMHDPLFSEVALWDWLGDYLD